MNNSENPKFTERIYLKLGRSHQLPYNIIIIIFDKFDKYYL